MADVLLTTTKKVIKIKLEKIFLIIMNPCYLISPNIPIFTQIANIKGLSILTQLAAKYR